MRRLLVPAVAALGLSFAVPAYAGSYEMKDLEALEKQESWQEAIQHLADIPPSKRNDAWNRIAEKAGAGVLAAVDPSKEGGRSPFWGDSLSPPQSVELADEMMQQYPSLKKSKVFMAARADAALKGFKVTFQNSSHNQSDDPWRDQLKKFVSTDTMTADLPLRAGKLVTSRLVAYVAFPFFKTAITNNAGACKDADVKKSLVATLAEDLWKDDVKQIVEKSCFNDLRGDMETELKKGDEKMKRAACPIFADKKVSVAACK